MRVYAYQPEDGKTVRAWKLNVSPEWAQRHDNGRLISCGLEVPADLSERSLASLARRGRATEITADEANHGGCQSSCIRRGSDRCSW